MTAAPPPPEPLETVADLDRMLARAAAGEAVLIFKHSTACPISAAAQRRFLEYLARRDAARDGAGARAALVNVIEARPVSNELARRSGVRHESPQALLIRGDQVLWHASHDAITGDALADAEAALR